ncbi:methyltransferase domain-containing protein [Actinoplanes sp. NPDC089786]|uniref:class I SAM-dependent methyltransferase n=1 Tax=Actinoplanes sp. NPDC089786 TaxID=3155185 RepID=UPI0034361AA0
MSTEPAGMSAPHRSTSSQPHPPARQAAYLSVPYPLDNAAAGADDHHYGLAHLLDPFSRSRLAALRDWTGARVLEVGCGKGSFALHLAELVGPAGQVIATDLKPPSLDHHRITVIAHDLTGDQPVPGGRYDLIHSRLVLPHLPGREQILQRLIAVLEPGGVLVEEAWQPVRSNPVIAAPDPDARHLYERFAMASGRVFDQAGTDPSWARRVHTVMTGHALTDVSTIIHGSYWHGGDPGARMIAAILGQMTDALLAQGMSHTDLATVLQLLQDPRLVVHSHLLHSTAGHRPLR